MNYFLGFPLPGMAGLPTSGLLSPAAITAMQMQGYQQPNPSPAAPQPQGLFGSLMTPWLDQPALERQTGNPFAGGMAAPEPEKPRGRGLLNLDGLLPGSNELSAEDKRALLSQFMLSMGASMLSSRGTGFGGALGEGLQSGLLSMNRGASQLQDNRMRREYMEAQKNPGQTAGFRQAHEMLVAAGYQPGSPEYQKGMASQMGMVSQAPQQEYDLRQDASGNWVYLPRPSGPTAMGDGTFPIAPINTGVRGHVPGSGGGGAGGAGAGAMPTPAELAKDEMGMRKEVTDRLKQDRGIVGMHQNVLSAGENPSAAGDLSMIFAYMKMLDPGSAVREAEFANAQNAAGVPDQVRNAYNRALSGQRLNPSQRQDFMNQAGKLASSAQGRITSTTREYQDMAQQYGYDPTRATGMADFRGVQGAVNRPQSGSQRAVNPQTGEAMILVNGQWVPER